MELHMLLGAMKKGKKLDGFIDTGLLDPKLAFERHEELVDEMMNRDYEHRSLMNKEEIEFYSMNYKKGIINKDNSLKELANRCEACCKRQNDQLLIK